MRTLLTGGTIYAPGAPDGSTGVPTTMVIDGERIAYVGHDEPDDDFDEVIRLGGALVTPAFVDAHVHTSSTGLAIAGLDLTGRASRTDILDRVAAHAREHPGEPIIGHGWEIPDPPTADELERAAPGQYVYLSRIDVHSAIVSSGLLRHLGMAGHGLLDREAHGVARQAVTALITPGQRRRAQRLTLRRAAEHGIGLIHELGGPEISSERDLLDLVELAGSEPGPEVIAYWGELGGVEKALELRSAGAAGDIFADGSFGSHTACLREIYDDADHTGASYVTAAQVRDHVIACARAGLQAGFHAIGDGGIELVVAGFEEAAAKVGAATIRRGRHRIEHVELADAPMIARIAALGVYASVQPGFDAAWGGPDGMYAARLGRERAARLNPFAGMRAAGIPLVFGSDSPVTPIDPWAAVRAAGYHSNPEHRLPIDVAFAAHTVGGLRAAGIDEGGTLVAGAPATYALWNVTAFPDLSPGRPLPTCRRTVVRGEIAYQAAA